MQEPVAFDVSGQIRRVSIVFQVQPARERNGQPTTSIPGGAYDAELWPGPSAHPDVLEAAVSRVERRQALVAAVAVQDARVFLCCFELLRVAQEVPVLRALARAALPRPSRVQAGGGARLE